MSILATVDDLDTRREAFYCLTQLPPLERVAFLYWMCDQLPPVGTTLKGEQVLVTITNPTGEPMETYLDMFGIITQYGFDPQKALAELERRTKAFTGLPATQASQLWLGPGTPPARQSASSAVAPAW